MKLRARAEGRGEGRPMGTTEREDRGGNAVGEEGEGGCR